MDDERADEYVRILLRFSRGDPEEAIVAPKSLNAVAAALGRAGFEARRGEEPGQLLISRREGAGEAGRLGATLAQWARERNLSADEAARWLEASEEDVRRLFARRYGEIGAEALRRMAGRAELL